MSRAHRRTNGSAPRTGYDAFKEFKGKRYTGMAVGRGHKWHYDQGDWVETKVTPDKWQFTFNVTKRRRGHAPDGSGAPVGTAYHWYILADQTVTKRDANSYTTEMAGVKFKLAHKRAGKDTWSASDRAQKRSLIRLLKEMIAELEAGQAEAIPAARPTPPIAKRPARSSKRPAPARRSHLAAA